MSAYVYKFGMLVNEDESTVHGRRQLVDAADLAKALQEIAELKKTVETVGADARRAALIAAARLIELNSISDTSNGQELMPRRLDGDRFGMAYAEAIRQMAGDPVRAARTAMAAEVDPHGVFERAYAEAAGVEVSGQKPGDGAEQGTPSDAQAGETSPDTPARAAPQEAEAAAGWDIEKRAWNCDEWPDWLHRIVDQTNDIADHLDMSSEQAHAYAVLLALSSPPAQAVTEAQVERRYRLCWVSAPRPPVHPNHMEGSQSFPSMDDAVRFMSRQAPDARFVSLTEIATSMTQTDRTEEARAALTAAQEAGR